MTLMGLIAIKYFNRFTAPLLTFNFTFYFFKLRSYAPSCHSRFCVCVNLYGNKKQLWFIFWFYTQSHLGLLIWQFIEFNRHENSFDFGGLEGGTPSQVNSNINAKAIALASDRKVKRVHLTGHPWSPVHDCSLCSSSDNTGSMTGKLVVPRLIGSCSRFIT